MSVFVILETLLIGPLKLIFECIFAIAYRVIGHPGLSVAVLSLIMNLLVLPLYKRADAMQEQSRDIEAKLHDGVAHIKKSFTGDERMMILQTYYRQNHYKPTDALNGSVSLMLEIPFFMAAYQFLSTLEILNGASFGPINDLGAPDGMLVVGSFAVNVLPILMTVVNVISSMIFLKGHPVKTKIQLYAMALFFLVFLYTSPSGLVFYWTLNNVFSLVKTIFYKLKNPEKVLRVLAFGLGLMILIYSVFLYSGSIKRKVFFAGGAVMLMLPTAISVLKFKDGISTKHIEWKQNRMLFMFGSVFLAIFSGLLIPSTIIAASPQEFVSSNYFYHPLWYIASSLSFSVGTFCVWMGVFYWLADLRGKVLLDNVVWLLCGIAFVNYMFFGTNLGNLLANLCYENEMSFSAIEQIYNLAAIVLVAAVFLILIWKHRKAAVTILLTAVITIGGMSALNVVSIQKEIAMINMEEKVLSDGTPNFQLSKTGKNVIVLMLDRGMNEYIPYIMHERPELKEQFAGFTYYSNVISHGPGTNTGSPALFGGYEYTPVEMNKRDKEAMVLKHNEALKVMPVLFSENGFQVTVCDPPYANYQWFPDLSVFDEYPQIRTYITKGKFSGSNYTEDIIQSNSRNFFCFSLMKMMPLSVQPTIYDQGRYNQAVTIEQVRDGISKAVGISMNFMDSYNALANLPNITNITAEKVNTCLIMNNETTHEPMLLQKPEYIPAQVVDNTQYDKENSQRYIINGKTLKMQTEQQVIHYHANMAALIQIGNWLDYLRENGVYENTRIIIASDHGRSLEHLDELIINDRSIRNLESYYPLLLVKDFNSTRFTESKEFMTNADVPVMAIQGIIQNPRNPFTGNAITSEEKYAHEQFVINTSSVIADQSENTFMPSYWASVKDNIWEKANWTFYEEEIILKDHFVS